MHDSPPTAPAPDAMARFRRWAAIAVAVAVIGYLCYALWRGFNDTATELVGFTWWLYVPVLLLTLVNYGLRYLKWHYLLGRLDIHLPHRVNAPIFVAGLAMVISPGKAGEVVKPWLVKVVSGAHISRTLPALVAERATDGIAVVMLAAWGVTTFYPQAEGVIWTTMGVILVVLVAISIRPFGMAGIGGLRRLGFSSFADRAEEAYLATRACLAPMPLLVTLGLSLVAWWAECVGFWLVWMGLGVDASLDASTFLYTFATVFGAPSPGGMGMADVALTEGAVTLLHVTGAQAVAGALLVRVATLWFGVALGAVALLRMESVIASATNGTGDPSTP